MFISPLPTACNTQAIDLIADLRKQVLGFNGKLSEEAKMRTQIEEDSAMLQNEITKKDDSARIVKKWARLKLDEVSTANLEVKYVVDLVNEIPDTTRQTERSEEVMRTPGASNIQRNTRSRNGTRRRESNTESNT